MGIQAETTTDDRALRAMRNSRRRRVVRLLSDRTSRVGTRELATHLVADEADEPLVDVTHDEVRAVRTDLVHVQLPELAAAGLVAWDREADAVSLADHPVFSDPIVRRILDVDPPDSDAVLGALASGRRRAVLSVLRDADGSMPRARLAREVVARERGDEDRPADVPTALLTALHHVHLPALEGAGLVAYDPDRGTASYEGHPVLDGWTAGTQAAPPPFARRSDEVRTIEGREGVVVRGQALFDRADDELFLMVTTQGLLEEGCIRRLRDAVDRGVDVYLGSRTPAVRDVVRERVPGAVIREPRMDRLSPPQEYERVGRLVFADREAVMLGTLGAEVDGVHRETAITGTGENNPLVALLCELLGSRLDHLDARSEDVLSAFPL